MFGKGLADALMLPLKSFNTLRTGVNWLLEKLGVINKESSDLDQKAAKANAATGSGNESNIKPASFLVILSGITRFRLLQVKPM